MKVKHLCVHLRARHLTSDRIERLRAAVVAHPGAVPVLLRVGHRELLLPPQFGVNVEAPSLRRAVSAALDGRGMCHVADPEGAW